MRITVLQQQVKFLTLRSIASGDISGNLLPKSDHRALRGILKGFL
jgi:hypothetical protein